MNLNRFIDDYRLINCSGGNIRPINLSCRSAASLQRAEKAAGPVGLRLKCNAEFYVFFRGNAETHIAFGLSAANLPGTDKAARFAFSGILNLGGFAGFRSNKGEHRAFRIAHEQLVVKVGCCGYFAERLIDSRLHHVPAGQRLPSFRRRSLDIHPQHKGTQTDCKRADSCHNLTQTHDRFPPLKSFDHTVQISATSQPLTTAGDSAVSRPKSHAH